MARKQQVVSAVGLPGHVKDVAEDGHRAYQHANAKVGGHAHQRYIRDAANPAGEVNDEREQPGQYVAQPGDEPDDSVKAETDVRAGNVEGLVQQDLMGVQRAVAKQPCASIPAISRSCGTRWKQRRRLVWVGQGRFPSGRGGSGSLNRCYNRKGRWRL